MNQATKVGESGGAGSRVFERVFRPELRPDSSIYGVAAMEERLRPAFRAISSFSSSSISTSFISSLTALLARDRIALSQHLRAEHEE